MTPRTRALPFAMLAVAALLLAACGGDDTVDGPPVTIASFNFPESEILGEIYAQGLESQGIPVERAFNLGARELIYPELLAGNLDMLPEYLGSALVVWFNQEPPADLDAGFSALQDAFAAESVAVLRPAPAENNQAFVVSRAFAEAQEVTALSDLADVDSVRFAGPPECEQRDTCFLGLTATYGLDHVQFESMQEAAARLSALDANEADMILLFSTDAPLASANYVVLTDDAAMLPPENITPVVRQAVIDAYGDVLTTQLDAITQAITTESLQAMNAEASAGRSPAEIATDWLEANT